MISACTLIFLQLVEELTGSPPIDDQSIAEESSWILNQLLNDSLISSYRDEVVRAITKEDIGNVLTMLHTCVFIGSKSCARRWGNLNIALGTRSFSSPSLFDTTSGPYLLRASCKSPRVEREIFGQHTRRISLVSFVDVKVDRHPVSVLIILV